MESLKNDAGSGVVLSDVVLYGNVLGRTHVYLGKAIAIQDPNEPSMPHYIDKTTLFSTLDQIFERKPSWNGLMRLPAIQKIVSGLLFNKDADIETGPVWSHIKNRFDQQQQSLVRDQIFHAVESLEDLLLEPSKGAAVWQMGNAIKTTDGNYIATDELVERLLCAVGLMDPNLEAAMRLETPGKRAAIAMKVLLSVHPSRSTDELQQVIKDAADPKGNRIRNNIRNALSESKAQTTLEATQLRERCAKRVREAEWIINQLSVAEIWLGDGPDATYDKSEKKDLLDTDGRLLLSNTIKQVEKDLLRPMDIHVTQKQEMESFVEIHNPQGNPVKIVNLYHNLRDLMADAKDPDRLAHVALTCLTQTMDGSYLPKFMQLLNTDPEDSIIQARGAGARTALFERIGNELHIRVISSLLLSTVTEAGNIELTGTEVTCLFIIDLAAGISRVDKLSFGSNSR